MASGAVSLSKGTSSLNRRLLSFDCAGTDEEAGKYCRPDPADLQHAYRTPRGLALVLGPTIVVLSRWFDDAKDDLDRLLLRDDAFLDEDVQNEAFVVEARTSGGLDVVGLDDFTAAALTDRQSARRPLPTSNRG